MLEVRKPAPSAGASSAHGAGKTDAEEWRTRTIIPARNKLSFCLPPSLNDQVGGFKSMRMCVCVLGKID